MNLWLSFQPIFKLIFKELLKILPLSKESILIIPIIALLMIWLMYRVQNRIKDLVNKEFCNNFPSIKRNVDDLTCRIEYLNNRLKEIEDKLNKPESKRETVEENIFAIEPVHLERE